MKLEKDGWYKLDTKTKEAYKVAEPIDVVEKREDLDDGSVVIVLDDGRGKRHEASMEILGSSKIERLVKYGFNVTPKNKSDLATALNERTIEMDVNYHYETVGLIIDDKNFEFRGAELISTDPNRKGSLSSTSSYQLKSKGSLKEWISMIQNHVKGTVELELMVALGVSGIVFRYLTASGIDLINPIIHLSGESSKGKTTATKLGLSVAGNPEGQTHSWNGTDNSFFATIKGNYGIPVLFDEISEKGEGPKKNVTRQIYQLANGKPRGRADKNGNLRKQEQAATVVFSTGEAKISDQSTKNTGVGVRILELEAPFTKDAQQAEAITKCLRHNYGHVLNIIGQSLIDTPEENTIDIFEDFLEVIKEKIKGSSSVADRVAKFYAAILTSVEFFNQSMQQTESLELSENEDLLNVNKIQKYLVKYELSIAEERDLSGRVYEALLDYIITNQNKIADVRNNYGRKSETIGYFQKLEKSKKDSEEIEIIYYVRLLKSAFMKFLDEYKFEGHKKIQTLLKEKEYIHSNVDDRIATQESNKVEGKTVKESFYNIIVPENTVDLLHFPKVDMQTDIFDFIESNPSSVTTNPFAEENREAGLSDIDEELIEI